MTLTLPDVIFVAATPIDLRLSFDRLAGIVREQLGADPRSETLVVFHNRRRTHVKLLWHNGRGYSILFQRLDRGVYRIPLAIPKDARSVVRSLEAAELALIVEGIDLSNARRLAANTSGPFCCCRGCLSHRENPAGRDMLPRGLELRA